MSGFGTGFVVGLLVGVAVGALLAPRSGRENRAILMQGTPRAVEEAPDLRERLLRDVRGRWARGRAAFFQGREEARQRLQQEFEQARSGLPLPQR